MSLLIEAGGMRSSGVLLEQDGTGAVVQDDRRLGRGLECLRGRDASQPSSTSRTRIRTSRSRIAHLVGWVEPKRAQQLTSVAPPVPGAGTRKASV